MIKKKKEKKKKESVDGNGKIASREREIENISWQKEKETTMYYVFCMKRNRWSFDKNDI